MTFDQYGIHLGGLLYIRFYALILLAGLLVGAWLTARRARTHGLDPEHVWNGLFWAVIPGLIGARLYHVLTPTPGSGLSTADYLRHPEQMLAIWNGGLGIYGAIIGGVFGIWLYTRRHKLSLLLWLDLAVPGLVLAQAIGRWANFVNNELYGAPSTLPWAIPIPLDKRLPGFEQYATYQPLFLYESLLNLMAFALLLWIERRFARWLRPGDLILIYALMYPLIRFLLDFVRLDSANVGGITIAQIVSALAFIAALTVLIVRHRRPAASVTAVPAPGSDEPRPSRQQQ